LAAFFVKAVFVIFFVFESSYFPFQVARFPRGVRRAPRFSKALCSRVVSPVTLIPQDKESCGSGTFHEENVIFHFRGVSHLPLQSTVKEDD
jgi:hypothetical protein